MSGIPASPGLRAAIGFLRVFAVFAWLWYLVALLVLSQCCLFGAMARGGTAEGLKGFGGMLLVLAVVAAAYAIRGGAWVLAEDLDDRHGGSAGRSRARYRGWGWSVACFTAGLSGGVHGIAAGLGLWLMAGGAENSARLSFTIACVVTSMASWAVFPWLRKRQRRSRRIGP